MSSPDPPQRPADARRQILDAAVACILDRSWRATSLTDIADRAGLSRPTVYKHAGDRETIAAAIREREVERFIDHLGTLLDRPGVPRDVFVEGVVLTVRYARDHELFQHLLSTEPEVVLPWLTRDAGPLLERLVEVLSPHIARAVARGELREANPEIVAEWVVRLAISLVLTPSVTAPLDQPPRLRRFLVGLFEVGLAPPRRSEP